MAHHIDSHYDETDNLFLPPLRTLGFNPQLTMNDSLLVQSYIEAYDVSYPEALRRIEAEVAELRQHLETEGLYELNDIGVLRLTDEGHLLFTPCEAGILTPHLYGLSSFEMKPLAVDKPVDEKETEAFTAEKPAEHAITIKMSWLRNVAAVAAAVIAFLMIGTPISNSVDNMQVQQSAFIPIPAHQLEETVAADTAGDNQTVEEETAVADSSTPESASIVEQNYYCIVLASQVGRHNAETFVSQLNSEGFGEARLLEGKFLRVIYGKYESNEQASQQLHELRKQSRQFREAWVMEVKCEK